MDASLASEFLKNVRLRTAHLKDKNVQIKFGHLTHLGARELKAYNGFLGVTVQQHFYTRHRIYLKYPSLPCICVYGPKGSTSYYPIELVTVY